MDVCAGFVVTAPILMLTLINGAGCESVSWPLRLLCKTHFLTSEFLSQDVDVRSNKASNEAKTASVSVLRHFWAVSALTS